MRGRALLLAGVLAALGACGGSADGGGGASGSKVGGASGSTAGGGGARPAGAKRGRDEAVPPIPPGARAAFDRARAALAAEANKEAVEHLREATRLAPGWEDAWRLLGTVAASVSDLQTAVEAESWLLERHPDDADAAALLADLALRLGDLPLCTRGLFALERSEPDEPRTLLLLARHAFESGKLDRAESFARRAYEADESLALAWHIAGVAAAERGADEQAIALFRKALRANPGHLGARDHLATLFARRGATEDAARHRAIHAAVSAATAGGYRQRPPAQRAHDFEEVCGLIPDWSRGQLELGRAYLELGRDDEALAALERSAELESTAEVHHLLAEVLHKKQRHQAADLHEAMAASLAEASQP